MRTENTCHRRYLSKTHAIEREKNRTTVEGKSLIYTL